MDVWELFPWDIQYHITSWIYVKDLLKLKEVSKGLQSIIDSPTFCSLQFNTNLYQNDIIIDLFYVSYGFTFTTLESTQYHNFDLKQLCDKLNNLCISHIRTLGVNNGLVLLEIIPKIWTFCRQCGL